MSAPWPAGFVRVRDESWTRDRLETLALKYDKVDHHGWYHNLDFTVADVAEELREGQILIDYSGGTGIFAGRLLKALGDRRIGLAIVDASPKFLRLALEKFRDDERVAFRLIRYLKEAGRLEFVDEVLDVEADALVSTNAIHLYYDLDDTLRAWARALKPGALAFVQSGNIRNPSAGPGERIIDETVESIHKAAVRIVRRDERWMGLRADADDRERMKRYRTLRRKYFLPVRPLSHYAGALTRAGFEIELVRNRTIEARVEEWRDFLSVYHEGVLGWVGGVEKLEGRPPSPEALIDRLALLRQAIAEVFRAGPTFPCCWTYVTCRRRPT